MRRAWLLLIATLLAGAVSPAQTGAYERTFRQSKSAV